MKVEYTDLETFNRERSKLYLPPQDLTELVSLVQMHRLWKVPGLERWQKYSHARRVTASGLRLLRGLLLRHPFFKGKTEQFVRQQTELLL